MKEYAAINRPINIVKFTPDFNFKYVIKAKLPTKSSCLFLRKMFKREIHVTLKQDRKRKNVGT